MISQPPEPAEQGAARVVRLTYYRIAGLHTFSASLVWAIHTLFFLEAGLDLLQVFLVHATYTASITLFEIPTGIVADLRGRRTSLLFSTVFLTSGTLVYLLATWSKAGSVAFCLGALALGVGTTFYSGALEAWLVDGLERADPSGAKDRLAAVLARGQVITSACSLVGTLVGGLIASLHLAGPYILRLLLLAAVFGLVFQMRESPPLKEDPSTRQGKSPAREMARLARATVVYGWRQPVVRGLVLVGLIHQGFLIWAFHAWQPLLLGLWGQAAAWMVGVVSALITVATMAGNAGVESLTRSRARSLPLLLGASLTLTLAAVVVGLAGSFALALLSILLMSAAWGVVGPIKQAWLHRVIPSRQRATVLSFDSLVSNAGGACGQGGLGYLARASSLGWAYVVGGMVTLLVLPLLARLRKT